MTKGVYNRQRKALRRSEKNRNSFACQRLPTHLVSVIFAFALTFGSHLLGPVTPYLLPPISNDLPVKISQLDSAVS